MRNTSIILFILAFGSTGLSQQKSESHLILISFDGFRYDHVKNFSPPNFLSFIKNGTEAEALVPSFPSKTFPNHYTLVTGLYPGHHGLVDNEFYVKERDEIYKMHDKIKVTDPYFYGGTPLWQLARQSGLKSASYFWVGSEVSDPEKRPDYYFPFNDSIPSETKVDQVLTWLKLPEKDRPRFISLYFSSPDHESHEFGPSSEQTRKAVMKADTLLGRLMKGLSEIELPVNVVIVSDHGMSELVKEQETYVFIDEIINRKDPSIKIALGGTQAHLYIKEIKKRDSVYQSLKAKEKNFLIYFKKDIPEQWHYQHEDVGDLLIVASPGHYIVNWDREKFLTTAKIGSKFGVHGYGPEIVPDMRGIFYANGPNIRKGLTIPAFQNIHVYPFLAKLLRLTSPPVDGRIEVLEKVYRK